MSDSRRRLIAAAGLVIGAVFGMAGTFAPSASVRALAWGIDGTALVVAAALLTMHYVRRGNDAAAAGFLVFVAGEGLILSAALDPFASAPPFAAGVSLWAASLALVSASGAMPRLVSGIGFVGALLFAVVAAQIFLGYALTPLSQPLPFFAYPFLAATLCGWAWVHYRSVAGTT